MKRAKYLGFAAVLAAVDQIIKSFVRRVPEGQVFFTLSPLFELRRVTNTGAAFSLLSSGQALVMLISCSLMVMLAVWLLREKKLSRAACLSVAGILGGGLGNLLDRIFFGGVTDYINLLPIRFPIFNFADICITLSVGALVWQILFDRTTEKTEEHHG